MPGSTSQCTTEPAAAGPSRSRCAARPLPRQRPTSPPEPTSSSLPSQTTPPFESVADSVIAAARPGTALVDVSTVSPEASARVAALAEPAGIEYLRAPVSGNPGVVRAGNVAFIVSGPRAAFDRAEPILRAIGLDDSRRRGRRAGTGRQARDQPRDRRPRATDGRGARARRTVRSLAQVPARDDGRLSRRRSLRQVQDGAAAPRHTPRRSRRTSWRGPRSRPRRGGRGESQPAARRGDQGASSGNDRGRLRRRRLHGAFLICGARRPRRFSDDDAIKGDRLPRRDAGGGLGAADRLPPSPP